MSGGGSKEEHEKQQDIQDIQDIQVNTLQGSNFVSLCLLNYGNYKTSTQNVTCILVFLN